MINALDMALIALAAAALCWALQGHRGKRRQRLDLDAKTQELAQRDEFAAQLESRYRNLFERVPIAIIVSRLDGTLIDINRAGIAMFGCDSREEALKLNMKSLYVNPAERERHVAASLRTEIRKPPNS